MENLDPRIRVYKNLIPNPQDLIKNLEENASWEKWWIFGKMAQGVCPPVQWDNFPTETQWEDHLLELQKDESSKPLLDAVLQIKKYFYIATKDYVETFNFELDNWIMDSPSFNVYTPNPEEQTGPITMSFHTDWQYEKQEARGNKFKLTCTMYLNDDYEGAELAFVVTDTPDDPSTYKLVKFKPSAGDVVVFPSTPPYYHGVTKLTEGSRYIIRTFWLEHFPGTPEWIEGEATHGEEAWAELQKAREKELIHNGPRIQDWHLDL